MTIAAASRQYVLPGHVVIPEPKLRFGGVSKDAVDIHPLRGLLSYGPFSRDKLAAVSDPIRFAVIAPQGGLKRATNLLNELEGAHQPRERRAYLPEFPGFSKLFGVRLAFGNGATSIELPSTLTVEIQRSQRPHAVLAEALTRALFALRNVRHDFDIVLIVLTREWEAAFKETVTEDFDLHDYIKAVAASEGICIQLLRDSENGALNYYCRCSVMWRLSVALYTKAGGIPWVIADTEPGTAFIGIDYALRAGSGQDTRFAICCSQVFDAEGSGLEFIAYEADGVRLLGKNPYLRRDQMMKVIARSLAIYQRKHAGEFPKRVVIQKNTEFKSEEVDGCFDALLHTSNVELIHVQQGCGWRGIQIAAPHQPHGYPCRRGTTFQLGPYDTLLWTQGNLPEITATGRADYYKEGKGIPEPLLLIRHAGVGSTDDLCREVLALTKMDWNNDGPYDRLPVTLSFAQMLAKIVKRMPKLEPRSYAFRLFM
jgi:hypothetical protein